MEKKRGEIDELKTSVAQLKSPIAMVESTNRQFVEQQKTTDQNIHEYKEEVGSLRA